MKEEIFTNIPIHKWLDDIDILLYSTHNEGTSVVAERFIREVSSVKFKKKNTANN